MMTVHHVRGDYHELAAPSRCRSVHSHVRTTCRVSRVQRILVTSAASVGTTLPEALLLCGHPSVHSHVWGLHQIARHLAVCVVHPHVRGTTRQDSGRPKLVHFTCVGTRLHENGGKPEDGSPHVRGTTVGQLVSFHVAWFTPRAWGLHQAHQSGDRDQGSPHVRGTTDYHRPHPFGSLSRAWGLQRPDRPCPDWFGSPPRAWGLRRERRCGTTSSGSPPRAWGLHPPATARDGVPVHSRVGTTSTYSPSSR